MAAVAHATFSKRKIFIRLLIKFGLLIAPIPIGLLMMLIFKIFGAGGEISTLALQVGICVAYLFYVVANFYSFWTSDDNQFLHDRLSGLTIVDEEKEF